MIYAPIIIPTLNRANHLKELIASLQNNSYAKYTELFIGLDFPPSEKYQKGYDECCRFLDSEIDGFAKVNIIKRDENFGPSKNAKDLFKIVSKKYDRYIFLEDDNVVSKNFIEFMDKALEKYEEDDEILQICGYAYPFQSKSNYANVIRTPIANAWGYGTWFSKRAKMDAEISIDFFKKNLRNIIKSCRAIIRNTSALGYVMDCIVKNEDVAFGDHKRSVYYSIKSKYCISPIKTMVHNYGFDGSGEHCNKSSNHEWINSEEFECTEIFDIKDSGFKWEIKDTIRYNRVVGIRSLTRIKWYILMSIFAVFGNNLIFKKIKLLFDNKSIIKKR